jgi:hypothetical protein
MMSFQPTERLTLAFLCHPGARPGDQYQHYAAIDPRVEPGDDG